MTNPKLTTNGQIALKLGWTTKVYGRTQYWFGPGLVAREEIMLGKTRVLRPPDFEHDWAHAGPLWAEMVNELGWKKVCFLLWVQFPNCWDADNTELSLRIAISRAWLAWKKEEHD